MTSDKTCPFCELAAEPSHARVVAQNELAFLISDGFPVSDGHSLIIPKRHIGSFFDATDDERQALLELVDQAKLIIDKEFNPDAYNVGINDGAAAGQTVPHLHIHLIPRYAEVGVDPRGGVRWVVPAKANYWDGLS